MRLSSHPTHDYASITTYQECLTTVQLQQRECVASRGANEPPRHPAAEATVRKHSVANGTHRTNYFPSLQYNEITIEKTTESPRSQVLWPHNALHGTAQLGSTTLPPWAAQQSYEDPTRAEKEYT